MSAPTDLTDDVLADRIRAACAARVTDLAMDDAPFDRFRVGMDLGADPAAVERLVADVLREDPRRASRPRGRALAVAAVLVLLAGIVAVLVEQQRPDPDRTLTTSPDGTTTTTTPFDGTAVRPVMPAADLAGLTLEDAEAWTSPRSVTLRTQLFGDDGGNRSKVLISIDPRPADLDEPTEPVRVRGFDAVFTPADGNALAGDWLLTWQERGATVEARSVGYSQGRLVDVLNGLVWRSDDPVDGFVPVPGERVAALAEAGPWIGTATTLRLVYRDEPDSVGYGTGRQLTVQSSISDSGELTPQYLRTWLDGSIDATGNRRSVRNYDQVTGQLQLGEPGQPDVVLDSRGTGSLLSDLEVVADGLRSVRPHEVTELQRAVRDRHVARTLLASVALDTEIIELRGEPAAPALCLRIGEELSSAAPTGDRNGAVSVVIDGHWYLALRTESEPTATAITRDPERRAVPYHRAQIEDGLLAGQWVIFVPVPDGVGAVSIAHQGYRLDRERPPG